jgi:hypothetical protein
VVAGAAIRFCGPSGWGGGCSVGRQGPHPKRAHSGFEACSRCKGWSRGRQASPKACGRASCGPEEVGR